MAKLNFREMQLFQILQKLKTGKVTVVKYGGEIKHIETQVNEILAAKAEEEMQTGQGLIPTRETEGPKAL